MSETPSSQTDDIKQRLWSEIERRRDELARLCADSLKVPAENPPGDTRNVVQHYVKILEGAGLEANTYEPRATNVSIVSTQAGPSGGPSFTFNGHLDHFPSDDRDLWTFDPYGGEIRDGKILGRGASDMRGGLTASLFSYLLLHEFKVPLKGNVNLMMVADEEAGGAWGTGWLLENMPELAANACVIGEPESPAGVRIGEKGKSQFRLICEEPSRHGGLGTGDDPVVKVAAALQEARKIVEIEDKPAEDLIPVLDGMKEYARSDHEVGRQWLYRRPSMSAGLIRGGLKVNIVPRRCEVEIDCRLPFGVTPQDILEDVTSWLATAGLSDVQFEHMPPLFNASATSPSEPLVRYACANATAAVGREPKLTVALAATDARYFRPRGVPAIIFGPKPYNMAALDEYITVDDLVAVTKVHLGTALDLMYAGE